MLSTQAAVKEKDVESDEVESMMRKSDGYSSLFIVYEHHSDTKSHRPGPVFGGTKVKTRISSQHKAQHIVPAAER
jgi:hypothetical protein